MVSCFGNAVFPAAASETPSHSMKMSVAFCCAASLLWFAFLSSVALLLVLLLVFFKALTLQSFKGLFLIGCFFFVFFSYVCPTQWTAYLQLGETRLWYSQRLFEPQHPLVSTGVCAKKKPNTTEQTTEIHSFHLYSNGDNKVSQSHRLAPPTPPPVLITRHNLQRPSLVWRPLKYKSVRLKSDLGGKITQSSDVGSGSREVASEGGADARLGLLWLS